MTDTHLTAPTRFLDIDGTRFAYRHWGNTDSSQPPLLLLQHFRGGMDHWDPFMTDGLAEGREVILISGDFEEVMWFQGLTAFLQPPKVVSPYDRTAF